ncbi:hypothetical protein RQP46_010877 [Phenoliferia psychrophenolica]
MSCLTPDAALQGDCGFLSANLYARSLFGEDALANLSIEKDAQGVIALSLGDRITIQQKTTRSVSRSRATSLTTAVDVSSVLTDLDKKESTTTPTPLSTPTPERPSSSHRRTKSATSDTGVSTSGGDKNEQTQTPAPPRHRICAFSLAELEEMERRRKEENADRDCWRLCNLRNAVPRRALSRTTSASSLGGVGQPGPSASHLQSASDLRPVVEHGGDSPADAAKKPAVVEGLTPILSQNSESAAVDVKKPPAVKKTAVNSHDSSQMVPPVSTMPTSVRMEARLWDACPSCRTPRGSFVSFSAFVDHYELERNKAITKYELETGKAFNI